MLALAEKATTATPAPLTAPMTLPWDYVASTEHHGPYITTEYGSTVCDFYCMSQPGLASVRNGGLSRPVPFMAELADEHAAYAVRAVNAHEALVEALTAILDGVGCQPGYINTHGIGVARHALRLAATTPHEARRKANDGSQDSDGGDWVVIGSNGQFFRESRKGTTPHIAYAGRYTETDARALASLPDVTAHLRSQFDEPFASALAPAGYATTLATYQDGTRDHV